MRTAIATLMLAALASTSTAAFASPADVLNANRAASGGDAWNGKEVLKTGYAYSGQGLTGKTESLSDLSTGQWVDTYSIGPTSGANGFDGTSAWTKDPSGTVKLENGGDGRQLAINEGYRRANMWWRPGFGGATVTDDGQKTAAGATFDVLTVTPRGGKSFDAWFDTRSHLLAKIVEVQDALTVTTTLSDYRAFAGAELAGKQLVDTGQGAKYVQTLTLSSAEFLPAQAASAYAAPKVSVADFSIAGGAHEATVPFQLLNNHIYANVSVDGHGPLLFIFDTGGHNLLTPPEAKELGVKVEGQLAGGGAGEGTVDTGLTKISSLQIGGADVANQVFAVIDFAAPGVEGLQQKGMVGFETFRRFVTRIDYGKGTLTLIDPKYFNPSDAGTPIPFVFNSDIPEVKGSFEGIPGQFDIDTGSRAELTLTKPFVEANKLLTKHSSCVNAVDGWGVGGPTRACVTRASELAVGPIKVNGVVTSFSTQDKGAFAAADYQGNIGTAFLKRFVVTFDYDHTIMYLKPVEHQTDVGTYDRAGMWINGSAGGYAVVAVTAHGPVEQAGIKPGDEITTVNGKPASSIPVYEMRKELRDDPVGTVFTFGVKRASQTSTVNVTLRDLI